MPNTPSRRAHRRLRAVLSLVLVAVAIGALVDSPRAGVAVSGGRTLPRGLFYSTLTWDPSGDRLLLFGGADGTVDSNELWVYAPNSDAWTRVIPAGTPPPGRQTHMAAWDGKRQRLLVFGGSEGSQTFADLLSYDPAANRWTRLEPQGERPSARALAGC